MIVACGDDEGGGSEGDGGVTPADLDDVEMAIDDLQDGVDMLNEDVTGLGGQIDDLTDDLGALTDDVQGRLEALEDPDPLSCSVEEVCIPDGIELTTTGIAEIVEIVCNYEVDCCSPAELNFKFGPGITSAEQCVALFTDVVNNGLSPEFLGSSPYIVYQVIAVAQALNDPDVRVELNREGIEECVESLQDRECPEYAESETVDPECVENAIPEVDVCALSNLLNGLQKEGELCGDYNGFSSYFDSIPECEPGLYCSWYGSSEGTERGICAKLPEEGDGCQSDDDCDPVSGEGGYYGSTLLYCNIEDAECQEMGNVGDPCTFITEDFSVSGLWPNSGTATSQDCMPHLTCSPFTNECVNQCNEGYFCTRGGNTLLECGEDRVCNATEFPDLWDTYNLGTCTDALETGDTCDPTADECESGMCTIACDLDTGLCTCAAPLKQPGEDCTTPGADALCVTNWCGTDSKCVGFCDCDDDVEGRECPDWFVDEYNREPEQCADGTYCDFGAQVLHQELGQYVYGCEPLIDNGTACDTTNQTNHLGCDSGFCDPDPADDAMGPTFVCSPKVGAGTACSTAEDAECPINQYCNVTTCAPYLPANAVCTGGLECAAGLVCVAETGTSTCQALATSGELCDVSAVNLPSCDPELDLTCIDTDGAGIGDTEYKCYNLDGGVADSVACSNVDSWCASGWCKPNAAIEPSEYNCAQPLEEGDDCDTSNITLDVCGPGLFCNHAKGETEGKCAAQKEPGESCKPYFGGLDCVNNASGSCVFMKDQFLCDGRAQPEETVFCDGSN